MNKFSQKYLSLFKTNQESFLDLMEGITNDPEPIKNTKFQRHVKYITRDYIMGII